MKNYFLLCGLLFAAYYAHAQWQFAGGVPKATINTLYNFEGTLLAGTAGGLLYYDNLYQSWEEINGNANLKNIVVITASDNKLYALSDATYHSVALGNLLLSSADFGITWDTVYYDNNDIIQYFTVHQDTLLLGSSTKGMLYSADNGHTWAPRSFIDTDFSYLKYTAQGIIGFTQPGKKLWKTSNWGLSWEAIPLPQPQVGYVPLPHKNRVLIQQSDQMYALNSDFSWTAFSAPADVDYFELLYADDKVFFGYGDYHYYWSYNKGVNWESAEAADPFANYEFVGDQLYAASFTEAFVSQDNGKLFQPLVDGLEVASNISSIATGAGTLLLSSHGYSFRSENGGATWQQILDFNASTLFSDGANQFYALAYSSTTPERKLWYSQDAGKHWTALSNVTNLNALCKNGTTLFSASGANMYKYTLLNNNYTETPLSTGFNLNTIEELKGKDSITIAIDALGRMIASKDFGAHWEDITYDLHRYNITFSYDVDAFIVNRHIFAVDNTTHHLFKLDEDNQQWIELKNKFSRDRIQFMEDAGSYVLMGVSGKGLFLSLDGENWQNVNDNITKFNPRAVAHDPQWVYVGMGGGGLWKRSIQDFDQLLATDEMPAASPLSLQLYPNPASGYFNIALQQDASAAAVVTVRMFDLAGKAIYSQVFFADNSPHQIDTSHLPKGVYLVNVSSKNQSTTQQIVIQ